MPIVGADCQLRLARSAAPQGQLFIPKFELRQWLSGYVLLLVIPGQSSEIPMQWFHSSTSDINITTVCDIFFHKCYYPTEKYSVQMI